VVDVLIHALESIRSAGKGSSHSGAVAHTRNTSQETILKRKTTSTRVCGESLEYGGLVAFLHSVLYPPLRKLRPWKTRDAVIIFGCVSTQQHTSCNPRGPPPPGGGWDCPRHRRSVQSKYNCQSTSVEARRIGTSLLSTWSSDGTILKPSKTMTYRAKHITV
jgi:hypothetical protein